MPRRRRVLSDSERALWDRVRVTATPLHLPNDPTPAEEPVEPPPASARPATAPRAPVGKPTAPLAEPPLPSHSQADPDQPTRVGRREAGIDRRTADRLRRGERAPDARLDLHGMTMERAHRVLDGFIAQSLGAGYRCILVITGKGRASDPDGAPFARSDRGLLRQNVPRWLRAGSHRSSIVGLFEAHPRHGGGGALYVYLKKRR